MVARVRCQILATEQQTARHVDGVERIEQIVAENAQHPLAEAQRFGQLFLRSLLLGDVRRRAHDADNPAATIAQCLYRFMIMTTLVAAEGQLEVLDSSLPSVEDALFDG